MSTSAQGLNFSFLPNEQFASTPSASMKLVVENPPGGASISVGLTDTIKIAIPSASDSDPDPLVETTQFTGNALTNGWNLSGPRLGKFTLGPSLSTQTLLAGDKVEVLFTNLTIVAATGQKTVTITTSIGGGSGTADVPVSVVKKSEGVIAWADPPTVGQNQRTELNWLSHDGSTVRVSGFTTGDPFEDFPVGGVSKTSINVSQDTHGSSQHTYPVQLLAEPGNHQVGRTVNVVVTLHTALISDFVTSAMQSAVSTALRKGDE